MMLLKVDAGADTSSAGGTAELVKCSYSQREVVSWDDAGKGEWWRGSGQVELLTRFLVAEEKRRTQTTTPMSGRGRCYSYRLARRSCCCSGMLEQTRLWLGKQRSC